MTLAFLLAPTLALGQSNSEIMATIQFNFSNPGARSLALGGAFTARADDATAAYSNPAGLPALLRPEVSLETRSARFSHLYTDRGHAFGAPSGEGIDTVEGLRFGDAEDRVDSLSFLSLVSPVRRGKLALALYRHETVNFEAAIESQGAFVTDADAGIRFRLFPIQATMEFEMVNFGVAAGYRVRPDLRIGVGVSLYELDLDSRTRRYRAVPGDPNGPAGFDPDLALFVEDLTAHDDDMALTLGLIWQASGSWDLGLVYRQGPTFDIAGRVDAGAALESVAPAFGAVFLEDRRITEDAGEFRVPDIYGLGLSYRPVDDLTVTFDYDRIEYSQLTDSIVSLGEVRVIDGEARIFQFSPTDYRIEDGDEVRLGVEYVFSDLRWPLAVRLGGWNDPSHRVEYLGRDARERARWAPGGDEVHFTGGLGLAGSGWQLDLAFDLSSRIDVFALSFVVPFLPEK